MGAAKAIKAILKDRKKTALSLADEMGKPRQTVANTFFKDKMTINNVLDYTDALGCELLIRDKTTGIEYPIYR